MACPRRSGKRAGAAGHPAAGAPGCRAVRHSHRLASAHGTRRRLSGPGAGGEQRALGLSVGFRLSFPSGVDCRWCVSSDTPFRLVSRAALAGIHPSTGAPIIMACGCVPVQTETEETEVRSTLSGVVLAGTCLALVNLVLATVEGVLGAEAEAQRAEAQRSGVAARLEAQGLQSSSTSSALAAVLGAFGADAWQMAVAMAVITGSLAVLAVPLTVTALVRKSRRLTRVAQVFAALTTALTLLVILGLGAAGHLATRDNAALSALYIVQGVLVTVTLGNVAMRLQGLAGEASFWLFAKTHAIDLNTEVMLELERRREEEEERIRKALADAEDDLHDKHDDNDGDDEDTRAMAAFLATPAKAGAAGTGGSTPAPTGAASALLRAMGRPGQQTGSAAGDASAPALSEPQSAKATEGRGADPASSYGAAAGAGGGEAYGFGQGGGYPAASEPVGAHWRGDGSYVDEQGGVTDAYGGYTWPDGAGYTDASGYFYAADGAGGYLQYPTEPPEWSQAYQQQAAAASTSVGGAQQQAAAAPPVAQDPAAGAEARAMASFGFEPSAPHAAQAGAGAAAAAAPPQQQPGRIARRASSASSTSEHGGAAGPGGAGESASAEAELPAPVSMTGVSGPDDTLVMPAPPAGSGPSTAKHRPSPATNSAISRIRKMAPKRITLSTPGAGQTTPAERAAATADEQPPARFPLF